MGASEEEQLALALKASMDTIREEQVQDWQVLLQPNSKYCAYLPSSMFYILNFLFEYYHVNVRIPMIFVGGLLWE